MPKTRTCEHHGLLAKIVWTSCVEPWDIEASHADAEYSADRKASYERGEWEYLDCAVTLSIETSSNWCVPHVIGKAYLFGIESDSTPEYLADTETDLLAEAYEDAKRTVNAIFSKFEMKAV